VPTRTSSGFFLTPVAAGYEKTLGLFSMLSLSASGLCY
jgi:hypothetical protein